jgi:hypothetical protein
VRVLHVNLLLLVLAGVALLAAPAQATPISAHAMVHTCCSSDAMKERIFEEAEAVGAEYVRVDVELSAIFEKPDGSERDAPDWARLDELLELAREHDVKVLGLLLGEPGEPASFGQRAGELAEHARDTVRNWEILNEPDATWAFTGTPEQYAAMLSAAHDQIKSRVPEARIVFGGLQRPRDPAWLERVFATPGADAIHKFDVANVHLRGPVDLVVNRYREFREWLGARGFTGPLWVTEHGYAADPAYQDVPAFSSGDQAQAAYLTQSLVGLGEAGAQQVFVTLRDNLEGAYASEGLVHIEDTPDAPATRRPSFAAVRRVARDWDQLMAWRREQRENERLVELYQGMASVETGLARIARVKVREGRGRLGAALGAFANAPRSARAKERLVRRLAQARALVAARRATLLWHRAYARELRDRAAERSRAVASLKAQIAGG